jgi:hypothetical protein
MAPRVTGNQFRERVPKNPEIFCLRNFRSGQQMVLRSAQSHPTSARTRHSGFSEAQLVCVGVQVTVTGFTL